MGQKWLFLKTSSENFHFFIQNIFIVSGLFSTSKMLWPTAITFLRAERRIESNSEFNVKVVIQPLKKLSREECQEASTQSACKDSMMKCIARSSLEPSQRTSLIRAQTQLSLYPLQAGPRPAQRARSELQRIACCLRNFVQRPPM